MPLLIVLLGSIISGERLAQDIWRVLKPIVEAKRDPTPEEWAVLDEMADRAHAEMRQAGDTLPPGKAPDA